MSKVVVLSAGALLIVSSLGLLSVYSRKPANEEEATVAVSGNTQLPHRQVQQRGHPIAPLSYTGDDVPEIKNWGNEQETIGTRSVTKGLKPRRIFPSGSRNRNKVRTYAPPFIRPAPLTMKAVVRNFDDNDVLCYPGDLEEHHPGCKCCGGWEEGYKGRTCGTPILFDCAEEYKQSHFRRAKFPIYY